jgi:3-isopropylmalate/(R)-2-methylmalate dehydratase small subunit
VAAYLLAHPKHPVRIDILAARLEIPGFGTFDFPLDAFAAHCLARGIDQLDFILQHEKDIARHEQRIGH